MSRVIGEGGIGAEEKTSRKGDEGRTDRGPIDYDGPFLVQFK